MDFATRIRALIRRNKQFASDASPEHKILIEQENKRLEAELHGRNDGGHSGHRFSSGGGDDTSDSDIFLPGSSGSNEALPQSVMLTWERPRAMATVLTGITEALTGEKIGDINFSSDFMAVSYSDVSVSPV